MYLISPIVEVLQGIACEAAARNKKWKIYSKVCFLHYFTREQNFL